MQRVLTPPQQPHPTQATCDLKCDVGYYNDLDFNGLTPGTLAGTLLCANPDSAAPVAATTPLSCTPCTEMPGCAATKSAASCSLSPDHTHQVRHRLAYVLHIY